MIIEDGTKAYWSNLRTLSSASSESSIPLATGFVAVDWSGALPEEVEIRFNAITTTGAPDSVIYTVWRYLGGKVDKISQITIPSVDYTAPIPAIIRFDGDSIWVTVSFSGGTAPTASGLVQYRVIK